MSCHIPMAHLTTAAWVARASRARVQRMSRALIMVAEEETMCWLQEGAGNTPRAPESGHIYRALAGAGAMPLLLQTSAQSTLQF